MTTFPRGNLPPIEFAEKSAVDIESSIITTYEAIAGRSLAQADPIRLFLLSVGALIVQQRNIIDFSAKQNLLSYAQSTYIDYIGEGVGVYRLAAKAAQTTIKVVLSEVQPSVFVIQSGSLLPAGGLFFATTQDLSIPIGETEGEVIVECQTLGAIGNGILPGQIKAFVEPIAFVQSVTNITVSQGGTDVEDDESLVERIRLVPSSFSVAGPKDAYIYWTKTASQAIADAVVSSPEPQDIKQIVYDVLSDAGADPSLVSDMESALDSADWPGTVDVRVILDNGELPGSEITTLVYDTLSDDTIRPLTDYVKVSAPNVVTYDLNVEYWVSSSNSTKLQAIRDAVEAAINEYLTWQKTKIGRDITPDELTQRAITAGAKRLNIISPVFTVITDTEIAQDISVTVSYQGLEDG